MSRTNLCGRLAGMLLAGLLLAVTEGVAHELAVISKVSEESPRCDAADVRSPEALTCSVPKIDVPASHALARDGFEQVEIGVVFHVLMGPDQDGDISEARVRAQLDVLNGAFRPFNISFFLAELIRHPHSDYFEFRCAPSSANGQEMKEKLAIDPVRLVNIYTCALPFPVVIGFSTFPWDAPDSPESHGIVLHHEVVTGARVRHSTSATRWYMKWDTTSGSCTRSKADANHRATWFPTHLRSGLPLSAARHSAIAALGKALILCRTS